MATSTVVPVVPTVSTLPFIAELNEQLAATLGAMAAALPIESQPTTVLVALQVLVSAALESALALVNVASQSTVPSDVDAYLWASNVFGSLQSFSQTLASIIGSDGHNAVTVQNTDIFTIAATQLGDWTRYTDILQINPQLTDFFIGPSMKVFIPPPRQIATS